MFINFFVLNIQHFKPVLKRVTLLLKAPPRVALCSAKLSNSVGLGLWERAGPLFAAALIVVAVSDGFQAAYLQLFILSHEIGKDLFYQ